MQLTPLATYVSSFRTVGSVEEAVYLAKAKRILKDFGATSIRAEVETAYLTTENQVCSTWFSVLPELRNELIN